MKGELSHSDRNVNQFIMRDVATLLTLFSSPRPGNRGPGRFSAVKINPSSRRRRIPPALVFARLLGGLPRRVAPALHRSGAMRRCPRSRARFRVGADGGESRQGRAWVGRGSLPMLPPWGGVVPGEGIEPSWGKPRGILSPVRLPVSPPRRERRYLFTAAPLVCQGERVTVW
jgi:hypothetical protein